MAQYTSINTPWTAIQSSTDTGNGEFNPCTGYMKAADLDELRCSFEVANISDPDGVIKPGYQTANEVGAPDAAQVIANINTKTGNGTSFANNSYNISATTKTKQLVRLGFWYVADDPELEVARVTATWELKKC